jgi:hypothetical protein
MEAIDKKRETSSHLEFAKKSQLLRWFHERTIQELKAMKKGFLAAEAAMEGRKQCK